LFLYFNKEITAMENTKTAAQAKERPILFSGPMVRAILEGRKTQTRRVIKPQVGDWVSRIDSAPWIDGAHRHGIDGQWILVSEDFEKVRCFGHCPYGKAGDRLWVRETWQAINTEMKWWHEWPANDRTSMNWAWTNPVLPAYEQTPPRWLPSIHMPRWASRITLEIISVRVERLQGISAGDICAEGVDCVTELDGSPADHYNRQSWVKLWDSINGARGYGWDVNPWVWVIEFKLAKP
jgi:hypothetical protein